MFKATRDLLEDLAPDIDSESLSKVEAKFQPFLTKAKEEFQKQKKSNVQLRFTREDGIFPAMIQSFFHEIAKFFREFVREKPTVADLMENAAKVVYAEKKNSAEYTKQKQEAEKYADLSQEEPGPDTRTAEEKAAAKRIKAIFYPDTRTTEEKAAAKRIKAIFDGKGPPISADVLRQSVPFGRQILTGGAPSSTSSPQTQNTGHGRTGSLGVAKK
jgi:hypothetical protein